MLLSPLPTAMEPLLLTQLAVEPLHLLLALLTIMEHHKVTFSKPINIRWIRTGSPPYYPRKGVYNTTHLANIINYDMSPKEITKKI
jgi:hypothetical protein